MREGTLGSFFRRLMLRIKRFFKLKKLKKIMEEKKKEENNKKEQNKKKKDQKNIIYNARIKKTISQEKINKIMGSVGVSNVLVHSNLPIAGKKIQPWHKTFVKAKTSNLTLKNDFRYDFGMCDSNSNIIDDEILVKKKIKDISKNQQSRINKIKNLLKGIPTNINNNIDKRFYKEIYNFNNSIKNRITDIDKELDNIKNLYNNNSERDDMLIEKLNKIGNQINELFSYYFNLKNYNYLKFKKFEQFFDYIKTIDVKNYKYYDNLNFYNQLVELKDKKDEIINNIKTTNKRIGKNSKSNKEDLIFEESDKIDISNDNSIIELRSNICKSNVDKEKNRNSKNDENINVKPINNKVITEVSVKIKEEKRQLEDFKKNIEKLSKNSKFILNNSKREIVDTIFYRIKGKLQFLSSVPIMAIGKNLPAMILGMYLIYSSIKKMKKTIKNVSEKQNYKRKKVEEDILKNLNSYDSLEYFLNRSIMELNEIDEYLYASYGMDSNLMEFKNQISEIRDQLYIQKNKINLEKSQLNKINKKMLKYESN